MAIMATGTVAADNMKFLVKTIFMLVLIAVPKVNAQYNIYTYYEGIYDDNIFNTSEQISDFVNSFSLGSAYNIESEFNNIQLYYEGNLSLFQSNISKSFNTHRIGLVETHLFSVDENPLNTGINFSFRNNKDEYVVYDFNQISAYINYRYSVSESDYILAGYVFNRNNYKNFSLFSNNEHKFFVSWISNFESRTSLTFNTEYLIKKYFEEYNYPGYLNESSQIKFKANLGQSLSDLTGLNWFITYQKNLSEGSRYLVSDSLVYYEEEIFNDIYSFDGVETGIGFTHFFNDKIQLNLESKYLLRNYTSLPAVGKDGIELSTLREDKQFGLGIGISYDLSELLKGISVSANWNYIKNTSNDFFYKYSNQLISISLDYDF